MRVNVVWDPIYGIGYELAYRMFHVIAINPSVTIIGLIVWPLFVLLMICYCASRLTRARWSLRAKYSIIMLFVLTLFLWVPGRLLSNSVLPSFIGGFSSNY